MSQDSVNDAYILKSLYSSLQILDLLSRNEEMGVSEICKELGQGKASTFRALYTMELAGYVDKTENSRYRLSMKFAHYGNIVVSRIDVLTAARPYLKALSRQFGQAAHYAVLDDNGRITFLCRETPNPFFQSASHAGYQMDAYCCANGKMLLSMFPDEQIQALCAHYRFQPMTATTLTSPQALMEEIGRIRAQGYSEDSEESEIGLRCFAVPLFNIENTCVGSISLSGSGTYMAQNRESIVQALFDTAGKISRELGYLGKGRAR